MHRERRFSFPGISLHLMGIEIPGQYSFQKQSTNQICRMPVIISNQFTMLITWSLQTCFSKCQTFNTHSEDSQLKSLECVTSQQQAALRLGVSHLLGWSEYLTPIFTFKSGLGGFHPKKDPWNDALLLSCCRFFEGSNTDFLSVGYKPSFHMRS